MQALQRHVERHRAGTGRDLGVRQRRQRRQHLGAAHRGPARDAVPAQPGHAVVGLAIALARFGTFQGVADHRRQRRRQHHLLGGERRRPAALQNQDAGGPHATQHRHRQQRREAFLAQARDVLEVLVAVRRRDRDRAQPIGDEADDPFAHAQAYAADRLGGKADVAAHGEHWPGGVFLAHVDADDVAAGDGRHLRAHGGQHLVQAPRLARHLDEAKDSVQAAVALFVNDDRDVPLEVLRHHQRTVYARTRFRGVSTGLNLCAS